MDFKKLLKIFEAPVGPRAVASTAQASGIADPNKISPGQKINIPMQGGGSVLSTVKKGDTLGGMINKAQTQQGARAAIAPKTQPNPNQAAVDASNQVQAGQTAAVASANAPSVQASADLDAAKKNVIGGAAPLDTTPTAATPAPQTNALGVTAQANVPQFGALQPTPDKTATGSQSEPASSARGAPAVAGTTNVTTRTPDQIAADNKTPYAQYSKNQATKSYASLGDFASAVGNKLSGGTTSTATTPAPAGDQTAGGKTNADFLPGSAGGATATTSAVPTPPPIEPKPLDQAQSGSQPGGYGKFSEEEELEEELEEMMRLSGLPLNEKAVSTQQQKFMGMVHAIQKGKKIPGASPELKKAAKGMSKKAAHDYAATKHKGLPKYVNESVMLEAGSNLEHIVTRFKHETKNFLNGSELDDDLYNALYDYYSDNGEMPYGVAKAREGDPYQWVSQHFENDLAMMGHQRQFQETIMPVVDNQLSELARLAGLGESRIAECGDMGMEQQDSLNVSTNMSSDGKKNVTISAQGEEAESLMQMLKLAGMGHIGHDAGSKEPVIMVSSDDDEMMDEEYANSPEEEYETVNAITRQGNDLNREKRQFADKPKLGDNPMAEQIVDEELQSLLDSVLIKAGEGLAAQYPDDLGPAAGITPEQGKADQARTARAQEWNRKETERQSKNVPAPGVYSPGDDEGPVGKSPKPPQTLRPMGVKK